VSAEELGLSAASKAAVLGGDLSQNVATVRAILQGEETGPRRDIVLLNSAAALVAADQAADLREGLDLARVSLKAGRGQERLERMVAASREQV
jgi:anthranilate phosphoribosyltransferase